MNLNKINSITNIGDYDVISKKCFFVKDGYVNECPHRKIFSISNYWGVKFEDELINIYTSRSHNTFYSYKGEKILEIENANIYHIFNSSEFLWYNRNTNQTLFNDLLLLEGKLQSFLIDENIIFTLNNNVIVAIYYQSSDSQSNWRYNVSPLGTYLSLTNEVRPYEVKRFIGIHERQLIVQLSNATFLFLDSETGRQNKIIHLNTEYPLPSPVFYEDASTAHIIGDSLVWLSNQRLIQIDLKTYAVKIVKDYFNAPREEQFRFMSNSHHKGLLYFVADKGWQYVTPTHVGVMNPETGEVLWHEQLQDTGGLREAPQATDDKLYIRTNKGVLHIFEKSI